MDFLWRENMHIKRKGLFACICALIVLLISCCIVAGSGVKANAESYEDSSAYSFILKQYSATYDVNTDRTMHVKEDITIEFTGSLSTGFMRDLPVNDGDRVTNISVTNGDGTSAVYSVKVEDSSFITIDIGDSSHKAGEYNYTIEYDYAITKPVDKNTLYLNVIAFGSEGNIEHATITLNLPADVSGGSSGVKMYVGNSKIASDGFTLSGKTIYAEVADLDAYSGVTMAITFADGVLTTAFDFMPYLFVLIGCIILAGLVALKFLVFNKMPLAPVVNFTAPNDMDPLVMGKLIDNKVNNEDVTSLIYYWANKGYIKIDLTDENDPSFIRIFQNLPAGTPEHQTTLYHAIFSYGEIVKVSQLENKLYPAVQEVTKQVNDKYHALYNSRSLGISIIFAILGALIMGLTPIIVAMVRIHSSLFLFESLIMVIPAFIVYGLTETAMYYKLKQKREVYIMQLACIAMLCVIFTILYAIMLPSYVLEVVPKVIICVIGFAVVMSSVTLICRTPEYTQQLNEIVGFRNFIQFTEKDRLEAMLKDDPQFYYAILPYAQVLGVSNIWMDKFKGLTVAPPQWVANPMQTYFEFAVINRAMRNVNIAMNTKMMARPTSSPSGSGLSGGGGHIGGFGGGGDGGGGFRGR
jgi:uncharacterized membrane protein YgcG